MDQLANHYIRRYIKFLACLLSSILLLTSCTYKFTGKIYSAIEPWKEWQIELKFKEDSTFEMVDSFGCNNFAYLGKWGYQTLDGSRILVLKGSTKTQYDNSHDAYLVPNIKTGKSELVKADKYFPVISIDTMVVVKNKILRFRGLDFRVQSAYKDLSLERAKIIELFYTRKLGKRQFIEAFGEGKGLAEARKNIIECGKLPIPLKPEIRR